MSLAGALLVGALALAWLGHWKLDVIQTGSMGDVVPRKSIAVVAPVDPHAVAVGDVVEFRLRGFGPTRVTLHRIVRRIDKDGTVYFATQGDANGSPDPLLVPTTDVLGIMKFHVDRVGAIVNGLHGWRAAAVFIGAPALGALVAEVRRTRRRRATPRIALIHRGTAGLEVWTLEGPFNGDDRIRAREEPTLDISARTASALRFLTRPGK